ncbi:oligosaccharide flippase family protein [Thermodesulfobacteriota bacterium]
MKKNVRHNIFLGSSIFVTGKFSGLFLQFFSGLLIIRYLPREEYGLFALSYTIINIAVVLANLGLNNGLPRMIPNYLAKKQFHQARQAIYTTIILICTSSMLLLTAVYFSSPMLSQIFSNKDMPDVLQKLCFLIPALALSKGLASVFRGVKKVFPQSFFIDFLPSLLRLPGYLIVIYLGLGLMGFISAQLMAVYISCTGFILYTILNLNRSFPHVCSTSSPGEDYHSPIPPEMPPPQQHQPARAVSRELILFSLPLMGIFIIDMLTNWSTTLLLGYYKTPMAVAALNALNRLLSLIPLPLHATVFMFLPIATQYIGNRKLDELSRLYIRITKWISLFTLPLAMILILDGEFVLHLLFKGKYDDLRTELIILVLGTIFHTLMGPNATTLLAGGKIRIILINTFINVAICGTLSVLIIPIFSVAGAALAISISLIIGNSLNSFFVYKKYSIHPIKIENILPISFSIMISIVIFYVSDLFIDNSILMKIFLYLNVFVLFIISPFVTKSIQDEEKDFFQSSIEKIIKNKKTQSWIMKTLL